MTTQPPPIEFKVRADARQAQQEMDGLNKKFKEGETASSMLDKRIEALTKDLDHLSTAVVSGKGNTEAYRAEMQRLERQLDALHGVTPKVAEAVEEVSKKQRNLGQATLEASRALEDLQYGVGGVVNNIPSLTQALGAGAGLTGILSVATVVLVKAGGAVYDFYQEMEEANRINTEWSKGLDKSTSNLRDRFTLAVNNARDAVKDAAKELRQFGMGANETRADDVRAAIEFQKGRISTIDTRTSEGQKRVAEAQARLDAEQRRQIKLTADERFRLKEMIEVENVVLQNSTKNREAAVAAIADEERSLKELERIKKEMDEKEKARDAEKKGTRASIKEESDAQKASYDQFIAHMDAEDKALKAVAEARRKQRQKEQDEAQKDADKAAKDLVRMYQKEARDEERARQKAQRDAEKAVDLHNKRFDELYTANAFDQMALRQLATDTEIAELDRLSQHEFDVLKARHDQMSAFYESIPQMAAGALGVVAGASAQMIDGIITGQEHAVEQAAVSVLKQAGTFVVGEGIKLSAAGVAGTLLGNPLGPGQVAGGLALTGLGLSMGGAGAAWAHQLGGGTIGKALPDDKASRSDRGASPRSSSDSSSGGPLVVNISYGVGGPLPEDTAREVRKVLDVDSRR